MKRLFNAIIISAIIIGLVFSFLIVLKSIFGDLRPSLLPPRKDIIQTLEKQEAGEKIDLPLQTNPSLKIGLFAKGLSNPRDLVFTESGILLVSIPSKGQVVALPDRNNDGKADEVRVLLSGLDKPHGLAIYGGKLFVAEYSKLGRYIFDERNLSATFEKKLFDIPVGGGHTTRSLAIANDGKLFLSIGSTCNVCVEKHSWFASVITSTVDGENPRVYAKGLRNSVFITIHPATGELWGTEMGRDFLGDDLPPEEINIIRPGDYGWPYCYGDGVHDSRFSHLHRENECLGTVFPVWKMPAHSSPLGLAFINSAQLPKDYQGDLLVAFHGSWNRSVPTGYKVVRLEIENGKVIDQSDFITGFLQGSQALGRPVDLLFDTKGSLFISDDKLGVIYKVVKR